MRELVIEIKVTELPNQVWLVEVQGFPSKEFPSNPDAARYVARCINEALFNLG